LLPQLKRSGIGADATLSILAASADLMPWGIPSSVRIIRTKSFPVGKGGAAGLSITHSCSQQPLSIADHHSTFLGMAHTRPAQGFATMQSLQNFSGSFEGVLTLADASHES
jgi:hypothetical protein